MSRKAEIQAEELNSPLRRSSRRTALTNSPAPATLSSRRTSQSKTEATETNPIKTRRASLAQENLEKNETTENKAAPKGRRASTAKEDGEEKPEPAKTRSRRSSAATDPATEETEKKQYITRRRKSTAAEEQTEFESVKPVRSRRNSAVDTLVEEDTAKKPIKSRRNSAKEETKEEHPKKILRSRRGSAAEENPEIETKEKKTASRGRRPSTDKLDDEPDTKIVKLTPVKSKRRPSITEHAANLEPIEEQESETKRKSTSPVNLELKKAVVNLTDIKFNKEAKPNLDLSTIDESSFTEESLNKNTSEKKEVTPRKSPRLNKQNKVCNSTDPPTPSKSSATKKESVDKEYSPGHSNEGKEIEKKSLKEVKGSENPEIRAEQNKVDLKNENVDEIKSEEHTKNESAYESLKKASPSPCKKLQFEPETTKEVNTVELVEAKEIDKKEEENVQTQIHDKSESIDQSVLEVECEQEKEYKKQMIERGKTSNPDSSLGSAESLIFHLQDDNVEDDLNTSKNSSSSDKENIDINSTKDLNASNANVTASTQEKLKSIIENADHSIHKEVQNVVSRVSNVFRPKMIENSFMEPMEVDESFLDITQNKKSLDSDESDIKIVSPAVSTPIVKRSIEKIENKEGCSKSKGDMEEIDQNNKQNLKDSKKDQLDGEKADESEIKSDLITVNSELTLEESEALCTSKKVDASKQEYTKEGQTPDTQSEDTINVRNLKTVEDFKMPSDVTIEDKKPDHFPKENITNLTKGKEEHDEGCESPLSEEEIGREQHSEKPTESSSFEIIEETPPSPHLEQVDVKLQSKSPEKMTSDEMIEAAEKEYLSETLESETQDEQNSSMKSESNQIQNTSIDELESEAGKFSSSSKSPLIKALVIELENKPMLMKSESPQPDQPTDELKPRDSGGSLRKSISPSKDIEDVKNEMEQSEERRSSRKSRSSMERQTEMDQNETSHSSRKSKSPQPQVANTEELKFENNETPLSKSKLNDKAIPPKGEMENLDAELNQDKICPRRSKSPQPAQEEIIEKKEISSAPKILHMPELHDSSEKILESETEDQSPVKKEDSVQESPKCKESGKMDISEDYEFEIPSDEEETDKSHNLKLEDNTTKSESQLFGNTGEVENSVIEQVQTSPFSSPLKRKSDVSEVEQNKKIKVADKIEENVQDDSRYVSDCEVASSDELPAPEEIMNTAAKAEAPTNETVMTEDNDESATDDLIERGNLASSPIIPEADINNSGRFNELLSGMKAEIMKEIFADVPGVNEDIPSQKEILEHNYAQSEVEDSRISAVDTDENVNTSSVNLTFEINSSKIDAIETETSAKTATEDELVQNVSDVKKRKKCKKKSKENKESSKKSTQIGVDKENANSKYDKTIDTSKEFDRMESDFQDVIRDSSDVKKEKKGKKKSKKQKRLSKQNELTMEESQLEESTVDTSVVKPKSPQKISNKAPAMINKNVKGENSCDDSIEKMKTPDKSEKNWVVDDIIIIESSKKKKSKKSLVEASTEGEFTSNEKTEKKKRKKPDITSSKSEENNENQKKSRTSLGQGEENNENQKKSRASLKSDKDNENKKKSHKKTNVDLNQVGSPRKRASADLDEAAKSKLDNYLLEAMSEMKSKHESYTASTNEEDNSEEENGFIVTMAEEGEEDTPSDDSNAIIDEGESINSTDSDSRDDYDKDEYDESDPFICDDEEEELLSGEEYDLGNERRKKKEKKSRIIKLDDCDDDVIKIKRKEKHIKKKKRTRIISISDSSDNELDNTNNAVKCLNNSLVEISGGEREEEINDDVIILEEKSTPVKFSNNQMTLELNSPNTNTMESSTKKRKSIVIHENINVADIKNSEFSGKIATMVDNFCDTIHDGEISMNMSLEYAVDNTVERYRHIKTNLRDSYDSGESEKGKDSKKQPRLSASLDNIDNSGESKQSSHKKRKSASLNNLRTSKRKKNKISRAIHKKKNIMDKSSHSKKTIKSQKRNNGSKAPENSPEDLRTKTFSIMNQLITDVKNRPVRTIKPSTTVINMNGSWISEVIEVKPSTTLAKRTETPVHKAEKIHPKDFRSQMLYDSSRVKRVDTKTLLRKRGAYF